MLNSSYKFNFVYNVNKAGSDNSFRDLHYALNVSSADVFSPRHSESFSASPLLSAYRNVSSAAPHLFHFEPDGASFVGYVFGQVVAIAADDA